jgi:hypothetical protein
MYVGVSDKKREVGPPPSSSAIDGTSTTAADQSSSSSSSSSSTAILKSILGNKLFWMVGIAHSLGHLAKGSDRLLGPFLQEATSLPSKLRNKLHHSSCVKN